MRAASGSRDKRVAQSPSHSIGQIIGYLQEVAIEPMLREVAERHGLYLDVEGTRPARPGKRLTWYEEDGTPHNLDFVLERGGTPEAIGAPVAFIESAWRARTKHSVAKAGELARALKPLAETYGQHSPFLGAIVSGVWTAGGLQSLKSSGIKYVYIPIADIRAVFLRHGIDIALSEDASVSQLEETLAQLKELSTSQFDEIASELVQQKSDEVASFIRALEEQITRAVTRVVIIPLHGSRQTFATPTAAAEALSNYQPSDEPQPLHAVEIIVDYSNGSTVRASMTTIAQAVDWLNRLV